MASLLRYISQVLWQRDTAAPESAATQSRKRSRMEAELDSGQAHAKKRQMSSPSPLLRLPVELRLKILQYLLWQTDTLEGTEEALTSSGQLITPRKCNNFSFCPAILRVCRRLHEEGEPLLYDNTFPCQMWYNRPHQDYAGYRSSLLRGEWDVMQRVDKTGRCESPMRRVPRYLVDNIRRLDLLVPVSDPCQLLSVINGMQDFVRGSRYMPNLSHLTIKLHIESDAAELEPGYRCRSKLSRKDYQELALAPLASRQGLKTVHLVGTTKQTADELASFMTTHPPAPAVDLPGMFASLQRYIHKRIDVAQCERNYQVLSLITFAHQAADLGDLEIFKNARSHLMLLVEILNMEECDRPHGRVIVSDLLGKDKWSLGSDYVYFGNASARKARDRREKQSPALGVLRKMWKMRGSVSERSAVGWCRFCTASGYFVLAVGWLGYRKGLLQVNSHFGVS